MDAETGAAPGCDYLSGGVDDALGVGLVTVVGAEAVAAPSFDGYDSFWDVSC